MKVLTKKLFLKRTTISNLTETAQRSVKGGGTYTCTNHISCLGNTCYQTCIPEYCETVTTSNRFCTEMTCI